MIVTDVIHIKTRNRLTVAVLDSCDMETAVAVYPCINVPTNVEVIMLRMIDIIGDI